MSAEKGVQETENTHNLLETLQKDSENKEFEALKADSKYRT